MISVITFGLCLASNLGAQDGSLQWALTLQGWSVSSPAISSDGGTIYVGVETRTAGRVVAVGADGSLRWSVTRPDGVSASPAVGVDGTVYVGCYDGKLYALSPVNGAIRWEYDAGAFIVSSPAIGSDGSLFFGTGDGRLHSVDARGARRWTFQTGDWVESSPALGADGSVYFGSRDKFFYALTSDGRERWRFAASGSLISSPAIGADGTIFFGGMDRRMYALTAEGQKLWEFAANGDVPTSPVLGPDGTVFFAALDSSFYALDPYSGEQRWRVAINTNTVSSAAVRADGALVFGADDGFLRALDSGTGDLIWKFDTRKALPDDTIESSPLIAPDGSIYFSSLDGKLYKLRGNGVGLSEVSNWPSFRADAQRSGRARMGGGGSRLVNLSLLSRVEAGETLIGGFYTAGKSARAFLIRAVGPGLASFGVNPALNDPNFEVLRSGTRVQGNDNWGEAGPGLSVVDSAAAIGAFPLQVGSRDAAVVAALPPGAYTAHLRSSDGGTGGVLFEIYDALGGDPSSRLVNLSSRVRLGSADATAVAGFVVGGSAPANLLLRAVGPGLERFGVAAPLARPRLSIYRGATRLSSNSGWASVPFAADLAGAARAVGAFPLVAGSFDAALTAVVQPGPYTVHVSGIDGSSGEVLLEVYLIR